MPILPLFLNVVYVDLHGDVCEYLSPDHVEGEVRAAHFKGMTALEVSRHISKGLHGHAREKRDDVT